MTEPAQPSHCMFGCTAPVPPELGAECLCVLHFTLGIEQACAQLHCETAGGNTTAERQAQIASTLSTNATTLARVALGAQRLSDELKKRILSTFLTLIIARENLDRPGQLEFVNSERGPSLARNA